MSGYAYGVLGAGRQGTAAAYDLAVRGEAERVRIADADHGAARDAAARVDRLAGRPACEPVTLDAADEDALTTFLGSLDAVVAAVPYRFVLGVTRSALQAGCHVCDLGGGADVVEAQLAMDDRARERGICVVPDCGEAPGLANNLVAHAISLLDEPEECFLWDGGLPQEPRPPWDYELTFSIEGLSLEYTGTTTWVRDGRPVEVDCLDPAEDRTIDLGPPFGLLEAFAANAGSTIPRSLGTRLRTFEARVLRYPGHIARFRAFKDLGLFEEAALDVDGERVSPRRVFLALLEPRIRARDATRDVVIARIVARGRNDGSPAEATVDLCAHHDEVLGFTAMEQTTGWHAAIVAHLMAAGRIEPGARPVELAVDPATMVREGRARGFEITSSVARM